MNEFRRTSNFTLAKNYQIITVPVIRKNWQRDATTRLSSNFLSYSRVGPSLCVANNTYQTVHRIT